MLAFLTGGKGLVLRFGGIVEGMSLSYGGQLPVQDLSSGLHDRR